MLKNQRSTVRTRMVNDNAYPTESRTSLFRRTYLAALGAGTAISASGLGRAAVGGGSERSRATPALADEYHEVEWGESAAVGDGEARTFVGTDEAGDPAAVGVWFDASALSGLPDEHTETVLAFPDTAETTNFTFLLLNWNPHGHEPPGIYDLPHFDFHFYFTPEGPAHLDEIEAGSCEDAPVPVNVTCETFERATRPVPPSQQPPDYQSFGAVVPRMGDHLTDPTGLEFTGATFTHTLIWGAFDGRLTFVEPMITNALFEELASDGDEIQTPVKMPDAFPEAGPYPTRYDISYHPDEDAYSVSFEAFEAFPASNGC